MRGVIDPTDESRVGDGRPLANRALRDRLGGTLDSLIPSETTSRFPGFTRDELPVLGIGTDRAGTDP